MKNLRKLLIPILIFLIPVLVILFLKQGKNVYKPLPHLGIPKGISANGDTVFHTIPEFSLTDQYGKPFGTQQLKGNIYVADFIFTRCPNICPVLTRNIKMIQDEFRTDTNFKIVSFTLDPKYDSVQVLSAFADKYEVNNKNWFFLTGPKDTIYRLMNQDGFLIVKPLPDENPAKFQHSEIVALVDKEGHIRGHYNGTSREDIERLKDEIKVLFQSYANAENNK